MRGRTTSNLKLVIPITLLTLLLGVASSANADGNRWVKVEGGSWAPGADTITTIKEQIQQFVEARARAEGSKLREWRTYTFQYQGRERNGSRFVFINAFCIDGSGRQLDKHMVLVTDGGTCFFNLKYDPGKNQFIELAMHGEA